jgi:hypothetical protein
MSHVAMVEIEIKDLESLKEACKAVGLEFREGQKKYHWYGTSVGDYPLPTGFVASDLGKCDHAIGVPGKKGAYEIGVVPRRDGKEGYALLWDFWNGGYGLQAVAGKDCNNLVSEYSKTVARKEVKKMADQYGMTWNEEYNAVTGETEITLRKYDGGGSGSY